MSDSSNNSKIQELIKQRDGINKQISELKGEYRVICDWCKSDIHQTYEEHFAGNHCYDFAGMPKRGIYMNEWDTNIKSNGRVYYKQIYSDGEKIK